MADNFTMSVDPRGLDRLLKKLNAIQQQIDTKGNGPVKQLLNITALDIARESKRQGVCPVDTGRLRSSIHPKFAPSESFSYVVADGRTYDGSLQEPIKDNEVVVGTNVEYAFTQEQRTNFLYRGKVAAMPAFNRRIDQLGKKLVDGKPNITIQ